MTTKISGPRVVGNLSQATSTSGVATNQVSSSAPSTPLLAKVPADGDDFASDGRQPIASPKKRAVLSPTSSGGSTGSLSDDGMGKSEVRAHHLFGLFQLTCRSPLQIHVLHLARKSMKVVSG